MFKTILLNKNEDGTTRAELTQLDEASLPSDGDVTVAIEYLWCRGLMVQVK